MIEPAVAAVFTLLGTGAALLGASRAGMALIVFGVVASVFVGAVRQPGG